MPQFVKIDRETAAALFAKPEPKPSRREEWKRQREEYQTYLKSLDEGEAAKLIIAEGESKSTIRARLNTAAKELGVTLAYKRTTTNELIFHTLPADAPARPKRTRKKKDE